MYIKWRTKRWIFDPECKCSCSINLYKWLSRSDLYLHTHTLLFTSIYYIFTTTTTTTTYFSLQPYCIYLFLYIVSLSAYPFRIYKFWIISLYRIYSISSLYLFTYNSYGTLELIELNNYISLITIIIQISQSLLNTQKIIVNRRDDTFIQIQLPASQAFN